MNWKFCAAILAAVLLLPACGEVAPHDTYPWLTTPSTQTEDTTPTTQPEETLQPTQAAETTAETVYIPEIYPDAVGIYIPADDGTRGRKLISEFSAGRTAKRDIDCFEVFASRESYITGSGFSSMWQTAWDVFEDTKDSKIGFVIAFDLADGQSVSQTVRKPSDAKWFYEYLEIYLYDDIHQTPGVRYTHLEDDEITDNTIISSIKLTSGSKIDQVGDIVLTAFVYNGEDCFDSDGNYIGQVFATVTITE